MDITCDLNFVCGVCGKDLAVSQDSRGAVYVEPCAKCLDDKCDEAYDKGLDDGRDEADD